MIKKLQKLALSSVGTMGALATSSSIALAASDIQIVTPGGFFTDMGKLISALLNFVIIIAVLLVFVYLLWGGIEWIMSGSDKGKAESARTKITSAIIGLIVLAASWAILTIVLNFLGYTNLQDVINKNLNNATTP